MINKEKWLENLEALTVHVAETGHFPNKHTKLNNWCRYQRKRIKAGTIPEEQRVLFEELASNRWGGHTGGKSVYNKLQKY